MSVLFLFIIIYIYSTILKGTRLRFLRLVPFRVSGHWWEGFRQGAFASTLGGGRSPGSVEKVHLSFYF